jgi:hypothetical protein
MFLGSHGIEANVLDEYLVQICWKYSDAIGGVRVSVADEDGTEAALLYQQYMTALRDGPYPLRQVRAWPLVALLSIAVGVPWIIFGRFFHKTK